MKCSALFPLLLTAGLPTLANQSPPKSGLDLAAIDRSVTIANPTDLPKLAYGKWLTTAQIPGDRPGTGTFFNVFDNNQKLLRQLLDNAAADRKAKPTTAKGRVGLFYRVAMDKARADRLGVRPLAIELREIAAIRTRKDLIRVIGDLQSKGIAAAFSVNVQQDDLNRNRLLPFFGQGGQLLPDRETYWNAAGAPLRKAYIDAGSKLFSLAGFKSTSSAQVKDSLALETELARVSSTPVELRDVAANYHLLKIKAFSAMTPTIDWSIYWRAGDIHPQTEVNVGQPKFFKGFDKLVRTAPIRQWQNYLRMQLLFTDADYLSEEASKARFIGFSAMTGAKERPARWKVAQRTVDGNLGDDLGQLYVGKAFSPEAKAKVQTLVHYLLVSLGERIPSLEWMGEETKKKALEKLKHFTVKVGYPDKWRTYQGLALKDDSWVANIHRAQRYEWQRQWGKLGKPIDRTEWGMSASTVNAYYNPYNNEIVFPAGILQPGFYDPKADDAANYGAVGFVIGHEITHGFDDQGAQFDGFGKRANWWTASDLKNFQATGKAIVAQYGALTNSFGQKVNGELTLGENMADIGGITIAYMAYQKSLHGKEAPVLDGYTGDQRFFIAASQAFKGKYRPAYGAMLVNVDPHSPDNLRSYVPASDHPAFYRAFGLELPSNLPHVW